jgi:ParB/RepB/Spo0J family partition protein
MKVQFKMIALAQILDSFENPRDKMDRYELDGLAESIRTYGVLQPLVVRPISGGSYEIIAGHRRAAAAALAELDQVPCIVRPTAGSLAALQLVENTQRVDLGPLEIAAGISATLAAGKIKQKDLAKQLGKSEAWVSKFVTIAKAVEKLTTWYKSNHRMPTIDDVMADYPDATDNERTYHLATELEIWHEDMADYIAGELDDESAEEAYNAAAQLLNPKPKQEAPKPAPKKPSADDDQDDRELTGGELELLDQVRQQLAALGLVGELAPAPGTKGFLLGLEFKNAKALRAFVESIKQPERP